MMSVPHSAMVEHLRILRTRAKEFIDAGGTREQWIAAFDAEMRSADQYVRVREDQMVNIGTSQPVTSGSNHLTNVRKDQTAIIPPVREPTKGQRAAAGCPRAWCACWGRLQVGLTNPKYNLALAWLDFRHVGKRVGAWAVMRRKGGGHVGRVVRIDASGNPVILSGNHGGRVGVGTYPAGRIVAYVEPGK